MHRLGLAVLVALQAWSHCVMGDDVAVPENSETADGEAIMLGPAVGWHDCMLCASSPWGEGTTMFAKMDPWPVPDNGTFYVRLNPEKVARLDPPFEDVDRISWAINPPTDDLAAVTMSQYIKRGPTDWYQSIDFFRHGGMAGTKAHQLLTGTIFFKDGRTAGLRANLAGPKVAPPPDPAPAPDAGVPAPDPF